MPRFCIIAVPDPTEKETFRMPGKSRITIHQLAEMFAQGATSGTARGGNLFIEGDTIYSQNRRCPIARRTGRKTQTGRPYARMANVIWNHVTHKHWDIVRSALRMADYEISRERVTNKQLAECFAKGAVRGGARNHALYVVGNTIFSYGPHFRIAVRTGKKRVRFTTLRDSITTDQHKARVLDALEKAHYKITFAPL